MEEEVKKWEASSYTSVVGKERGVEDERQTGRGEEMELDRGKVEEKGEGEGWRLGRRDEEGSRIVRLQYTMLALPRCVHTLHDSYTGGSRDP